MNTWNIVFYHTKEILKGRGKRLYLALALSSLTLLLCKEALLLFMDVDGNAYLIANFIGNLLQIVIDYTVLFLFVKAIRKETFHKEDIKFVCYRIPLLIFIGFLLSLLQIFLYMLCTLVSGIQILYVFLYASLYVWFLAWNACVAFGIYDQANFIDDVVGFFRLVKDHAGEVCISLLPTLIWYLCAQVILPLLCNMLLDSPLYAGSILPSLLVGGNQTVMNGILITLIHLIYYSVLYICLMPGYTYIAKLYNDNRGLYMPSAKRTIAKK